MIRVGVDVGGTFTDVIMARQAASGAPGVITVTKVPSTPHDQSEGVVAGILQVCARAGVKPGEIDAVYHGTTVATNMIIERAGARVGMLTTRGFRDILHMARHKRPHNFSLQFDLPWQSQPLVRRRDRLVISERIMPPLGEIVQPLDEEEVRAAAKTFANRGMDAVIVGFLFSFLNSSHELRAKEILRESLPDAFICCSSEVVNTLREYERFSSTAMNAYIGPKTSNYLNRLKLRLEQNGIRAMVRIMQSNGGISTIAKSSELPIGLLMSGPAGGVIGGTYTAANSNVQDVITVDIGGTSADISVIQGGKMRIKNPRDTEVAGLPVLVPMIDIDAIGAGGGSVAYLDPGRAFRVGPRSAGAVPGPACYGNGGTEPTVTDAQVVLGRLDPDGFLGGDLKLDRALAEKAIKDHIADPLGMTVKQAALGILRIMNNNMALAINANSVAKGIDPRGFSLMCFGGAGPLHAVSLAEIVHAKDVIAPLQPGITAATGLLATHLKYEFTHSAPIILQSATPADFDMVNTLLAGLTAQADAQLDADGIATAARRYERIVECRYLGQGFELRTALPAGTLSRDNVQEVVNAFYEVHKQVYGHAFKDQMTEAITFRVIAYGEVETLVPMELAAGGRRNPPDAVQYSRETVFDDGASVQTPRINRNLLLADDVFDGPAIITQHNSTTIVPPGYQARVLAYGDIHIRRV